jgi:hypothetical protein
LSAASWSALFVIQVVYTYLASRIVKRTSFAELAV